MDRLLVLKNNPPLKQRLLESEQAVSEPVSVQIKILRSGDIRARADAAFQLRKMGPSAQGAILVLIETLYDPKIEEHNTHWGEGIQNVTTISPAMEAAETLVMFGNPAVEPLVAVLEDANPSVRKSAARILGQIKDPQTVEPLIAVLKDADPDTRQMAIQALGQIKDPRVVAPLIAVLADSDPRLEISRFKH